MCGDLVDGHISLSSHELNQTMKLPTIISAIFVPLTFVAGVYGMNFENMPESGWSYAYFSVLGVMAVMAIFMLVMFRQIKWL
jgi:magnesium transporter